MMLQLLHQLVNPVQLVAEFVFLILRKIANRHLKDMDLLITLNIKINKLKNVLQIVVILNNLMYN